MSDGTTCTAGLPGCTSEQDHDGGQYIGPWRSHQLTTGFLRPVTGERRRTHSAWNWKSAPTYDVTLDVKATACIAENGLTHEFVYLVDDRRSTTLTGDAAHALGLSLVEAAYRTGYLTREEAIRDLLDRFDRIDELSQQAVAA